MILHNLFLLSIILKEQEILTWDLFLNCFDTLCLEAQLDLDSTADESSLQGYFVIVHFYITSHILEQLNFGWNFLLPAEKWIFGAFG